MKNKLGVIVLLLLIATGLRAWGLDSQSIWFDEGFSWHAATQPTLSATVNGDSTNPPLYYLLLHVWIRLVGDSEFGLRSLSLLLGVGLLAVMAALAKRWFNTFSAMLTLALGVFTPLLWWASQEARMYNLLALALLSLTAGLLSILRDEAVRARSWLLLLAGELGALYTHNTGVVVLGAANLVFASAWLISAVKPPRRWRALLRWAGIQTAVVILWLPELLSRFRDVGAANAALRTPPELSLDLLRLSWQALWASSWEMVIANPPQLQIASIVLLSLLVAGLFALRHIEGRFLWGLLVSLYAVMILALTVLGVNLHGRYLVMLAPLIIIVVGAGLDSLPFPPRTRHGVQIAVLCAIAITWFVLPGHPEVRYQHDQAREMVAYYAETLAQEDVILTWSYAERYELQYYADRSDLTPRIVTLPEGADRAEIIEQLTDELGTDYPLRAEINTWYAQASDRRGMLPCLLGHNNLPPLHSFTVQGMTTTGYVLEQPVPDFEMTTHSVNLGEAALTGVGISETTGMAGRGLCIPVQITIQSPHDAPLGAAINLYNDFGWELTGGDAPLLSAGQVPSNNLAVGETATAYPLMYPPAGLPTDSYPVQARIYSDTQPDGLDVLDPTSGAPTGKNTAVGYFEIAHDPSINFTGNCALRINDDLTLANCDSFTENMPAAAGETLRFTFAWQTTSAPLPLEVMLSGEGWQVTSASVLAEVGALQDWHTLTIPADASGPATLAVRTDESETIEIAGFTIDVTDHLLTPPPTALEAGIQFADAGILYGMTTEITELEAGESFAVELVWHAGAATSTPYNVTVQLLSSEGILLAQHDGEPDSGSRPTTGWLEGEYIIDRHELQFREEMAGYTGAAQLIVALYDPQTGTRLQTRSGSNYAMLGGTLTINLHD